MRKVTRGSSLNPHIRRATKEDFEAILSLENISIKEEIFNRNQLRYLLLKAKSLILVAVFDNKIIGSIILLLRRNISNIRIYSLNVHPGYRQIGIGNKLMESAEIFAYNEGFRSITLEVGTHNKAAQNLYRKRGFRVEKTLEKYYKNGKDAMRLIKQL